MTRRDDAEIERDLDAVFELPLADFTASRNALAKRLKQSKRDDESERVLAMAKPPVSAWTVNQLYRQHRKQFDQLIEAGERLSRAHRAQLAGKAGDIPGATAARREALSALLQSADKLLTASGHNASPDTLRRIQTTLETLSTASVEGLPFSGRLTADIGPAGFESLAALVAEAGASVRPSAPVGKSSAANLTAAKAAVKSARQELRRAEAAAQNAAKRFKEAAGQAKARENRQRRAEEQLAKAREAAELARRQAHDLNAESERAAMAAKTARQALDLARTELLQLRKTLK